MLTFDTLDHSEINVEEIMHRIREHIAERESSRHRGVTSPPVVAPPPLTVDDPVIRQHIGILDEQYDTFHLPMYRDDGWIKSSVKGFIKKFIGFYTSRQAVFNASIVQVIRRVALRLYRISDHINKRFEYMELEHAKQRRNLEERLQAAEAIAKAHRNVLEEKIRSAIKANRQSRAALYDRIQSAESREQAQHRALWKAVQDMEATGRQEQEVLREQLKAVEAASADRVRVLEERLSDVELTIQQQQEGIQRKLKVAEALGKRSRAEYMQLSKAHGQLHRQYEILEREHARTREGLDLAMSQIADVQRSSRSGQRGGFPDHAYLAFENQHRGSREEIKERQKIYLPLFEEAIGVGDRDGVVLDVGCGRGEFLELLREHGIHGQGIDIDEDMVRCCTERGLKVEKADAIEYMERLDDHCLTGVMACQVLEHFDTEQIVRFIELCYQKIRNHGKAVFETINPQSIIASATNFYLDMSHVKPLHPEALKFLAKFIGFSDTEIHYLMPYPAETIFNLIEDSSDSIATTINQNFEKLNHVLFGYENFALICRK